ncbi:MAG: hypothetical protein EBY39_11435 [Flavobacteriia bacterium]|nr:hypothetical protein [Flavobacteriia bacterium]
MQFFETQKSIKRVGPQKYVIGNNILDPQLSLDGFTLEVKNLQATTGLFISGINFIEYITGDLLLNNIENNFYKSRYELEEAFEEDENGDLMPSNSKAISDSMWILRNEDDLELRANHWRYNTSNEAFTEDVSIGIYKETEGSSTLGSSTPPEQSDSQGYIGQVAYDNNNFYLCIAENQWKKMVLVDFD